MGDGNKRSVLEFQNNLWGLGTELEFILGSNSVTAFLGPKSCLIPAIVRIKTEEIKPVPELMVFWSLQ